MTVAGICEKGKNLPGCIKNREFIDYLGDY
jgi:hypothetical protein